MSAWLVCMILLLGVYELDFWRDTLSSQRLRTWAALIAAHVCGLAVVEWFPGSWQLSFIAIDLCAWGIISSRPSSTVQRDIGSISLAMAAVTFGTMLQPNYHAPNVNWIQDCLTWLQFIILAGWSINGSGTVTRWYRDTRSRVLGHPAANGAE